MKTISRFTGKNQYLSNFFYAPIVFGSSNIVFPTNEHGFVYFKTKNIKKRKKIRMAPDPSTVKSLGRNLKLREDWEEIKDKVMYNLVLQKFKQHPYLANQLLRTRDAELVEGNTWHDNYWGVCSCMSCIGGDKIIRGKNKLGKILMQVRAELR